MVRKTSLWPAALSMVAAFAMAVSPAAAQIRSVDPDQAIDGDLSGAPAAPGPTYPAPAPAPAAPAADPVDAAPLGSPAPAATAETFSQLAHLVTGRATIKKPKKAGLGSFIEKLRKK